MAVERNVVQLLILTEQSVKENLALEGKRCLIATASCDMVSNLARHFKLDQAASSGPDVSKPSPFLFRFYDCHALALQFFIRIWVESGADQGDHDKIMALSRWYVDKVLQDDDTWFIVRQ